MADERKRMVAIERMAAVFMFFDACRLLLLNVGCTRSYAFIVNTPRRDDLPNQEWFFAHVYRIQGSPMRFEILTAKIPQIMRVPEMADSIYM